MAVIPVAFVRGTHGCPVNARKALDADDVGITFAGAQPSRFVPSAEAASLIVRQIRV